MHKRFIEEQTLIEDSYRLAVQIYKSGYRPDFIVGVWRGGSTVGIYVQECLQYLGVETDHIAIRTSYRGMDDYLQKLKEGGDIRAHGLQYLFEKMNASDNLLIVDDVYSTGLMLLRSFPVCGPRPDGICRKMYVLRQFITDPDLITTTLRLIIIYMIAMTGLYCLTKLRVSALKK